MKEYIRTTHNFSNITREWIYRGEEGQDKHLEWYNDEVRDHNPPEGTKWSFGVHGVERDRWMDMDWIVWQTIRDIRAHAGGNVCEFEEFVKNNPNYCEIIQQQIEKDLEYYIKMDMVRVREK